MEKRKNLIMALKLAAGALEKNTVIYDWKQQASCNCGIVAQALTGMHKSELEKYVSVAFSSFINGRPITDPVAFNNKLDRTWKNLVIQKCSITGKPVSEILSLLLSKGLTTEDIMHLEYMENPAILERSGIKTGITTTITEHEVEEEEIVKKGFLGIGRKTKIVKKIKTIKKKQNHYSIKENLIKYLTAWAEILEEQPEQVDIENNAVFLEERLLRATSEEKYKLAAEIRDKIQRLTQTNHK